MMDVLKIILENDSGAKFELLKSVMKTLVDEDNSGAKIELIKIIAEPLTRREKYELCFGTLIDDEMLLMHHHPATVRTQQKSVHTRICENKAKIYHSCKHCGKELCSKCYANVKCILCTRRESEECMYCGSILMDNERDKLTIYDEGNNNIIKNSVACKGCKLKKKSACELCGKYNIWNWYVCFGCGKFEHDCNDSIIDGIYTCSDCDYTYH